MRADPRSRFFPQKKGVDGTSIAQPWYAQGDPSQQYADVLWAASSFGTGTRGSPSGAFPNSTATIKTDLFGLWNTTAGSFAVGAFVLKPGIWVCSFSGYWDETAGRGLGSSRGVAWKLTNPGTTYPSTYWGAYDAPPTVDGSFGGATTMRVDASGGTPTLELVAWQNGEVTYTALAEAIVQMTGSVA